MIERLGEYSQDTGSVTITGHYGDDQQCQTISVYLTEWKREDFAAIIDAIVNAHASIYDRAINEPQPHFDIEKFNLNTRKEWFGN